MPVGADCNEGGGRLCEGWGEESAEPKLVNIIALTQNILTCHNEVGSTYPGQTSMRCNLGEE